MHLFEQAGHAKGNKNLFILNLGPNVTSQAQWQKPHRNDVLNIMFDVYKIHAISMDHA